MLSGSSSDRVATCPTCPVWGRGLKNVPHHGRGSANAGVGSATPSVRVISTIIGADGWLIRTYLGGPSAAHPVVALSSISHYISLMITKLTKQVLLTRLDRVSAVHFTWCHYILPSYSRLMLLWSECINGNIDVGSRLILITKHWTGFVTGLLPSFGEFRLDFTVSFLEHLVLFTSASISNSRSCNEWCYRVFT